MAVRSKYIKSLMDTKNSLDKQYQEVIAESMKNIIGENAKEEVRRLLKEAEDEDSFSEEEVDDDTATTDKEENVDTDSKVEDGSEDNADDAVDTDTEKVEDMESSEADPNEEEADDDLWNDLEQCKDADGEYDCRGMDDGNLLKVLKAMGPEDGIRVMKNDKGQKIKKAGPSTPVEIMGLTEVPEAGDTFYEVKDEKMAKHLIERRKRQEREQIINENSKVTLSNLFEKMESENLKQLNIIVKADVQGSVEAVKQSLEKLSNDEVKVRVIHANVGAVTETDVTLAKVSKAIIIAVKTSAKKTYRSNFEF